MKTENSVALDRLPSPYQTPRFVGAGWSDRASMEVLMHVWRHLRCGVLTVRLPDGQSRHFQGREAGPVAEIDILDYKAFRRLLTGGDLGFAESYIDGDWDTPDLTGIMQLVMANLDGLETLMNGTAPARLANRLFHRLRDNSRRGARRNISFHYDLGNDFYAKWLDTSMTYSSALYDSDDIPLEAAQQRKYRRILDLAGIGSGEKVLEIGCGWGGFMEHAAHLGCEIDGLTLSREQLDYANARMQTNGLDARASARLTDYRDSVGQYDAVVSIEMLEAVGEARWPDYFNTLYRRLKPGAAAVLQVITIDEAGFEHYRNNPDFIQRHVFPGGMLPTRSHLDRQARAAGLVPEHAETFGLSYARTLAQWRGRFEHAWLDIRSLSFDERFFRLWSYYLCYCETGFRSGAIDVGIYRFRRPAG